MTIFRHCRYGLFITFLGVAALTSCSKAPKAAEPPERAASGERSFDVRGILRGVDAEEGSVTIEHEDIPGFMPAMTMPFDVKDPAELNGLAVGSAVAFRFVVTDSDSWITGLRAVDPATVRLPERRAKSKAGGGRLKEGDKIPEFNLFDQENRTLTRESLAGKATVLTFIFTRCPVPNFCPLMSNNFGKLQEKLAGEPALAGKVRLLSISFDPADDAETLSHYAASLGADPAIWWHAGGTEEETAKLTHAFSVYVQAEGGVYSHGLCTALILPDGTIKQIWRGNSWEVAEIWQALEALK